MTKSILPSYGDMYRAKNENGQYFCKRCGLLYNNINSPKCSCEEWYYYKKANRTQRLIMIPAIVIFIGYSFYAVANGVNQGRFTYHGGIAIVLMFVIIGLQGVFGNKALGRKQTEAEQEKGLYLDLSRYAEKNAKEADSHYLRWSNYHDAERYREKAFENSESKYLPHETRVILLIVFLIFLVILGFLAVLFFRTH